MHKLLILLWSFVFSSFAHALNVEKTKLEERVDEVMHVQTQLSPIYFHDGQFDREFLRELNKIGHIYFKKLQKTIPGVKLKDITFVGSTANYTYENKSDMDIHLVVDTSDISCDQTLLNKFLIYISTSWHRDQASLKLLDQPLQISITTNLSETGGIYSILNDRWIRQPVFMKIPYTRSELIDAIESNAAKIEQLQAQYEQNPKQFNCSAAEQLQSSLKQMRTKGLHGEYGLVSIENNIYRILRSLNYLNQLRKLKESCAK